MQWLPRNGRQLPFDIGNGNMQCVPTHPVIDFIIITQIDNKQAVRHLIDRKTQNTFYRTVASIQRHDEHNQKNQQQTAPDQQLTLLFFTYARR